MSPVRNEQGVALTVAVIFGMIIALIAGLVVSFSYNHTRQIQSVGPRRTTVYYKAQAGFVDATWRIRVNQKLAFPGWNDGLNAGKTFNDAAFDPPEYYIDIETGAFPGTPVPGVDVRVDIGARDAATGLRRIDSVGLD